MNILSTKISGCFVIEPTPFIDERGFFTRIFCEKEMKDVLQGRMIKQINHSATKIKGTIRGMHYQLPPLAEMKIVKCIKGSIFDICVDLRKNSPTFLQWHGEILSSSSQNQLVVPEGCAHGFETLEDDVEMIYSMTEFYSKEIEGGIMFNDPKIGVEWKFSEHKLSEKDLKHPLIRDNYEGITL